MKKLLILLFVITGIQSRAEEAATWFRRSAISPDGETILFSYKGDIFTVPAAGGTATRLTSNGAYDGYACWSPDGRRIAFSSDRYGSMDVFVMPKDGGTATRLTTHSAQEYVQTFLDNDHVLYSASYMPTARDIIFPSGFSQVYSVDLEGHRPRLFSALQMEQISVGKDGRMLYHNNKGYEDEWRKHHHSPITRDLYLSQVKQEGRTYQKLTTDNVENRNAVWAPDGQSYYYLSEKDGTFNVYKAGTDGSNVRQLTHFRQYPVRYLSVSTTGTLCFSWDGGLYTMTEGSEPQKVNINVVIDNTDNYTLPHTVSTGASSFDVSKDEKEMVFALEGDLYATVMDYPTTKRLTHTPTQEASPSFSPDGRTIAYTSERGGTWNLYLLKLTNKNDKNFTYATDFKEELLVGGTEPCILPKFSPDGKKIAFLANRSEIRVVDVKSKSVHVVLPARYNFSYSDGDVGFEWSPDSRWILTSTIADGGWNNQDVAIVSLDGKKVVNLTQSGYTDAMPSWALGGKAILWASDRAGYRSHGSWGAEDDAYLMFLDREAYELATLDKENRALYQERLKLVNDSTDKKKSAKTTQKATTDTNKTASKKKTTASDTTKAGTPDTIKPLKLDFEGREDRVKRLTINSSQMGGLMYLSPDGKKFYYNARFEGGYDLWVHDLEDNSTKILVKGLGGGAFVSGKKGDVLYVLTGGKLKKLTLADGKTKDLPFSAEVDAQSDESRAYVYDHCVNQIEARFCDENYHGVDFKALAAHYRRFLPAIGNNRDLGEMVSELLGELNCSHTGLKFRSQKVVRPTAQLGAFFNDSYDGDGLLIDEVIAGGPLDLPDGKIKVGSIITEIDHHKVLRGQDYFPLLEAKAGRWVLLTLTDGKGRNTFETHVRPITTAAQNALLYKRWVKRNQKLTDDYSKGQIGYVHIEDMDSKSFRTVYSEILGKYRNRRALVVDERHNGGGWLHNDLGILLSGRQFQTYTSRGQTLGPDPYSRWFRPSCVLVCEDCYSNANGFPSMYKTLGLGKLVGMPMAGTMTAVWWERQLGGELTLGLPEVNCLDMDGQPLENRQLDPDVEVDNTPAQMLSGDDAQLRRAIDLMLEKK